ncbi:MAG: hypothetical protein Q8P84_04820 [Deltaproteobacteria bacterium]|nr:hypothetical protein [Deltaproteobacteria bacterium]MDZ4224788.1 hypothetical protein [bacterium]
MKKYLLLTLLWGVLGSVYPQIPFTSGYPYVVSPNPAPAPNLYGPVDYYEPSDAKELEEQKEARKEQMMEKRGIQQEKEVTIIQE